MSTDSLSNIQTKLHEFSRAAWFPYALIFSVALIAHPWALAAEFFMDDGGHILTSEYVLEGNWTEQEWRWLPYLIWSTLYSLVQSIHPAGQTLDLETYSPLFHAFNLSVHLAIAALVFFCGKDIFERSEFLADSKQRKRAALLGALIFACHPIGSEPVHYARCLMIDLVTLFSVATAWSMFRFVKKPSIKWALITTGCIAGATISKQPGLIHAASNVAIICAATLSFVGLRKLKWQKLDSRMRLYLVGCGSVLAIIAISFTVFWDKHFGLSLQHNWGIHALTQGRLFWSYLVRIIVGEPGR